MPLLIDPGWSVTRKRSFAATWMNSWQTVRLKVALYFYDKRIFRLGGFPSVMSSATIDFLVGNTQDSRKNIAFNGEGAYC